MFGVVNKFITSSWELFSLSYFCIKREAEVEKYHLRESEREGGRLNMAGC